MPRVDSFLTGVEKDKQYTCPSCNNKYWGREARIWVEMTCDICFVWTILVRAWWAYGRETKRFKPGQV